MDQIKNLLCKILIRINKKFEYHWNQIKLRGLNLGYRGKNSVLNFPSVIANPSLVYLHDYARIQGNHIIYNYTGKFIMKEYSGASIGLLVVTGNHTPTVGIPQYLLAPAHVNDKETDIVVEEDVWIGAKVTLISGASVGRGAVIGANALVNKPIPPYAIAVGSPAKVVGVKFTIDQILKHEAILYPESKRFTREYLNDLFLTYFQNKKVLGIDNLSEEQLHEIVQKNNFTYLK